MKRGAKTRGRGRGRGGNQGQRGKRPDHRDKEDVAHALGPMPSRGHLDGETLKYFTELGSLLDGLDEEERGTLCANALVEAEGKELQLSCHSSCSRMIEKLLQSSDVSQNMAFFNRCSDKFASIAMDPSGSHVAEAVLKSMSAAVQEQASEQAIHGTLENICKVVKENGLALMTSRCGSHVLRCCLSLLSGKVFETVKNTLPRKLGKANPSQSKQQLHDGFPKLLRNLTSELLDLSKASMSTLRVDPVASPVLQAILRSLDGDKEAVAQAITVILETGDEISSGRVLESGDALEKILEMMKDQSGSHLMEVILEEAPDVLYMELLQQLFLKNLRDLAAHQIANFVVQTLISCARQPGQVNLILDKLKSSLTDLIKHRKGGVIASLAAACGRFSTRQGEICRALAVILNPDSDPTVNIVSSLFHLESYGSLKDGSPGSKLSVLGCAILQTLFTFSKECGHQFLSSFVGLGEEDLLEAANDKAGCHVVEAFLKSSGSAGQKRRVIEKLKGHFADLAMQASSHYLVLKCYDAADMKLKEVITSELVPAQGSLSKTKQGPYILSKLNVAKYAAKPETWKSSETSRQSEYYVQRN